MLIKIFALIQRYILQLAIANLLFLLTLPFEVTQDIRKEWIFPEWMCKTKQAILSINYYASIMFLMVRKIIYLSKLF